MPPPPRPGPVTVWTLLADRLGHGAPNWRSLAIMHLAMHDALNAAEPRYARFAAATPEEPSAAGAAPALAMAAAAFQVLLARHPDQAEAIEPTFRAALEAHRVAAAPAALDAGARLGAAVGLALVEQLTAALPPAVPFPVGAEPGQWRPTPPFHQRGMVAEDRPLLAGRTAELRGPPPPPPGSARGRADLDEVRRLGGELSSARSAAQTEAAVFWARQTSQRGFVHLGAALLAERPPEGGLWAEARIMALLAAALADAYVVAWDEKRRHAHWRPITAIAEAGAGGPATAAAGPHWEPLLPTPPHPDYPSGHSADCAAGALVVQGAFGPGLGAVTYVAVDARPPAARRFPSLAAAALECSLSRIWAGAHSRAATEEGRRLGEAIAARVLAALPPLRAAP